jgi:hypothetical protein
LVQLEPCQRVAVGRSECGEFGGFCRQNVGSTLFCRAPYE